MTDLNINLEAINLQDFYGVNNQNLAAIKNHFPHLKIIARDQNIQAIGSQENLQELQQKLAQIIQHLRYYNRLNQNDIHQILETKGIQQLEQDQQVLVHGVSGRLIKAESPGQQQLVKSVLENDMVFAVGPAGTGKTYTSVAMAVRALKNKEVRKIILTRPAVEAGESLGFLPGDLKEKLDPYMQPLYDSLRDMIHYEKLNSYLEKATVEIAPLAFMRGRTLDHAFVILDEAQNTTPAQMKMFLTRMGRNAKFIITGDLNQVDLPNKQKSGLKNAIEILQNVKGIGVVELSGQDIMRHKLVKQIITAYQTKKEQQT